VKVFKLAAGLAVGYVLGSRAGREKYEQIVAAARRAQSHPAVTQAQQKARALGKTASDSPPADRDPVLADVPASATSGDTTPRPPRRRPKTTPTTPAPTIDPLT
jgi:hypothetical protein